ncbi:chorismate synthase [Cytobacillus purgationiresistens]|uniref:Chorismate synthase n=1 Tax=Cytobacillus purgationiresistens TaxID=863449 RepID=A0ABU0ALA8_9BACI|nr:chorismate synthase [Cytobacillus purgationiresistens]MDQ0272054.1 chorismate synthase [Cytobacillus purgationiresistens]
MRFITAGESHGPRLTAIIEGLPAGMPLSVEDINIELSQRQKGYGRGRRMQIEKDQVEITAGVRHGYTLGSPVALTIENHDWKHWTKIMAIDSLAEDEAEIKRRITRPRPGHADLVGGIKYGHRDMRNVLERSSARETAIRVAVGAVAKKILSLLNIEVASRVIEIGGVRAEDFKYQNLAALKAVTEDSPVRCSDKAAETGMMEAIDEAKKKGDSIGGVVEVIVEGMPVGVGSYVHHDRKLDAKIANTMISINAFKGVEFGLGFEMARMPGSKVHDEIIWDEYKGFSRKTNRLGGFEGGMTTGMPIVVRGVMKPIPTLYKPLMSVDIESKATFSANIERSDSCAVPAASVVAEAVVSWELAAALTQQFDSDKFDKLRESIEKHKADALAF